MLSVGDVMNLFGVEDGFYQRDLARIDSAQDFLKIHEIDFTVLSRWRFGG